MASVLIVDDDDRLRDGLQKLLLQAGYDVDEASDGREAMVRFQARPAQVVLLDIIMPEQEGIETILRLRALDPRVSILAMSGGGRSHTSDFLMMAQKLGADASLAKPFRSAELLETLAGLLRKAGLQPPGAADDHTRDQR